MIPRPLNAVGDVGIDGFDRRGRSAGFRFVTTESAGLERNKVRRGAGKGNVGGEFALEHLAGKDQLVTGFMKANGVTDERALKRRGQLRGEVAYLVGMRHQHQCGLFLVYEIFERGHDAIRFVPGQFGRIDHSHLGQLFGGNFLADCGDAAAEDRGLYGRARFSSNGLRRRHGFPGDAVQFAFTLFSNDENCVCHLVC